MVGLGLGVVAGTTVTVQLTLDGPKIANAGTHNYLATPADVKSAAGTPAAAYANFPTSVI